MQVLEGELSKAARSVWAKSPEGDMRWLPLWQHMDDSADVAARLFDEWLAPSLVRLMAEEFGGDESSARTAVTFLAGIHDLGKATPAFAIQHDLLAQRMRSTGLAMPETKLQLDRRSDVPHAVAGHHLLTRWLVARGWHKAVARTWAVVLGGHHGVPPDGDAEKLASLREVPHLYGEGLWESVQRELVERMAERTRAVTRLDEWRELRLSQQFQVLATGLVIVSDWIASNTDLFPYLAGELPEVADGDERVAAALDALRLPPPWRVPRPIDDVAVLYADRFALPDGATPRPVQHATVDVARDMNEPGLMILEAPMGEGKTEAALAAAEVLARRWGAGGLFVALPTQATTDAMFVRIVAWLDRMGAEDQDVGGSIMLSHGKARFNRVFRGLMAAGRARGVGTDSEESRETGTRHTRHAVVAHAWLSGRKKAHLANFTIGTIDQLLFAGLKSRHLMLRHLALAGKVVILDEIHAYDAYMNSYLTKVLTWLGAYGVPVVALSATLPGDRRSELVTAYQAGRASGPEASGPLAAPDHLDGDIGYPVLTWTDGAAARVRVTDPSGRHTTVHLHALDDDRLVATLRDELADGGAALVVRNTVARVLDVADELARAFPGEVTVAHSRFITADRTRKDEALLKRFGPPGKAERPHRHIVVASQVVEQSLDVDFDVLVTDLAPVDLVLQRMGRLQRHDRGDARPPRLRTARTYITGADFSQDPPELEEKAERYVYDRHTLLRAAAVLLPRFGGTIELPDDIALLVQQAYGAVPVGPPQWHDAMAEAEDQWRDKADKRRDKASRFQIDVPGRAGKAIVGWVAAGVGDADDQAEGQGQVRDGAPSLEVLVVQADPHGQWRTPSWLERGKAGLPVPRDEKPPDELGDVLATCALRLPLQFSNADAEEALWAATPEAWERSPAIYRLPVLVVDEDGWAEINDRRVRYTAERGLEVFTDAE